MLTHLIISTVIMALLLGYYVLQLRTRSWFQFNRFYLLGLIPFSLWLPLFRFTLPVPWPFDNANELAEQYLSTVEITDAAVGLGKDMVFMDYLGIVYLLGVLVFVVRMGRKLYQLKTLTEEYSIQQKNPFYQLFYTGGRIPTSSFMRNIFWDETAELTPEEEAQVMAHEMAHIRYKHSWDIILMELMQVLLWFYPFVYWIKKELQLVHEFQADHIALGDTTPVSYASLIVKKVFSTNLKLGHTFFETPALARIKMLKVRSSRYSLLASYIPLIPLTMGIITFSSFDVKNKEVGLASTINFFPNERLVEVKGDEADVNAYAAVDEEPFPVNMKEVQKAIGYPEAAREAKIEGNMMVRVLVNEEGKYSKHTVVKQVHPTLAEPVEAHISKLVFTPAIKDGKPIKCWINIPFNFILLN
ncbi:MAG: M56 family metallopeptidase [Bacteroidota bacterium]